MTDWPVRTLGEVCELISRGRPPSYCEVGGVVVLNQKCVRNGKIDLGWSRRTDNVLRAIPQWAYLREGDTLINSTGAGTLGRASFLAHLDEPATFDTHLTVVRPISDVCWPAFAGLVLNAREKEIVDLAGGATGQTELPRDAVRSFQIPLPPLEEQKRIVALLDAATARVTELTELGSRHSKLETEMQSAIVERLLGPERGWNSRPLNEWCSEIGTGPFGSLVHKADYVETGMPLVNPMNMKEGQIVESGIKRVSPSKAVELNRYILKAGDIVLGRRGEMGRCAVVRSEHDGWICGTGSFFLRPNEDCSPDLLALWLSSRQGRSALCSISSGTTMDNLGNRELGLLQVAFPDRPTQEVIVSRASALAGLVSEMQIHQHDRSVLLKSLQQSILEAAFAGDL